MYVLSPMLDHRAFQQSKLHAIHPVTMFTLHVEN